MVARLDELERKQLRVVDELNPDSGQDDRRAELAVQALRNTGCGLTSEKADFALWGCPDSLLRRYPVRRRAVCVSGCQRVPYLRRTHLKTQTSTGKAQRGHALGVLPGSGGPEPVHRRVSRVLRA